MSHLHGAINQFRTGGVRPNSMLINLHHPNAEDKNCGMDDAGDAGCDLWEIVLRHR